MNLIVKFVAHKDIFYLFIWSGWFLIFNQWVAHAEINLLFYIFI